MKLAHRLEYAALRILYFFANILPEWLVHLIADALSYLAFYVLRFRRQVTLNNIEIAFPEIGDKAKNDLAAASYRHFSRVFINFIRLSTWSKELVLKRVKITDEDVLEEFLSNKRGRIFMSGHFGDWELLFRVIALKTKMGVVAKMQNNPLSNRFIVGVRNKLDEEVLPTKQTMDLGIDWLKNGYALAMVGDQDARHHGIFVPFFNKPASTYVGAAVLARKTQSDIYFMSLISTGRNAYQMRMQKLFNWEDAQTDKFVEKAIRKYTQVLEEEVRQYPAQYFWMHKRWKTQPPASS
jgi:KDO2-lipid IV(A) lauroyltransferase